MSRGISIRRWRRWAMILAVFAIGIPFSTALFIRSSRAHSRLRQLATEALREELGLSASLGAVHAELWPFAIVASDVALDDPVYGPIARAEQIRIRPSLRALLRGTLDLHAIELDRAEVRLTVRGGEVRNLPRIEGGGGAETTLPFHRLVVRDATLALDADPIARGEVALEEITVSSEPDGVLDVIVRAPSGAITHAGGTEPLRGLAAHLRVARDGLRIPRLELAVGPLRAEIADGFVPLPPPDPFARPAGGTHAYRGELALDYDLGHLSTLRLPFELPALRGRLAVRARLHEDSAHAQRATGTLQLDGGGVLQFGIGETVLIEFDATREEIRIPRAEVRLIGHGGRVAIAGTIGLHHDLAADLRAEVEGLSFGRLMEQFSISDNSLVEWIFDGTLLLRGSLREIDLAGPIDLRTHDFLVADGGYRAEPLDPILRIPRGHFRGRWSIRRDGIRFFDLVADLPHSRLFGDVLLGFHDELRVSARADPADLRDVSPLSRFTMAGVGTASCEIDGVFQDPRVRGHVRIAGFEFDGFRVGDVESDAVLDRDGLGVTFPHVVVVKNDSRYVADDLYLDFHRRRFRMAGQLHFERLRLADFYHVFGYEQDERFTPYQGVAHGDALVTYTNGWPGDSPSGTLDVAMRLGFRELSLAGYRFDAGQMIGRWRWLDWSRGYRGAELEIDHVELAKGGGTVTLGGSMALGGALRMTASADAIALRDIEGIGDRLAGIGGVASVTALVGGTPELLRVDADVSVTNVTWAGRALGDGRAYVHLTHQTDPWIQQARAWAGAPPPDEECPHARLGLARADWPADPPLRTREGPMPRLLEPSAFVICGRALDGRVAIDLAVGRTERHPLRGRIALDGIDLAATSATIDAATGPPQRARLTGEIAIEGGGLHDLGGLRGHVRLTRAELGRGDLTLTNRGDVLVSVDNGVAIVERARFVGDGVRIRVRGQYTLPAEGREGGLALSIRGNLDLGVSTRLTPTVTEAAGRVDARVALSGPITDPELYGDASVSAGLLRIEGLPAPFLDVGAHLVFSARSILLEDLRARFAGGTIRGRGEAMLADGALERYAVDLDADGLALVPAEGLEVGLSADLGLSWNRGARLPTLAGELRVERLAYTRAIDLGPTLGELSRTERAEVVRYDPSEDRVALDLGVVAERPFVVRNDLVDAEVIIDDTHRPFRIVGTDQRFGVLGDMALARGRIFFRNSVFEIQRDSRLWFDDESRVDPRFDVRAVTDVVRRSSDLSAPRWRIFLEASGTPSSFEIVTRSEPDLPQEDVLMLLAVGMTRSELEAMRAGDVTSTAALEALTTVTGLDREVARAVPVIDDFRITTAYSVRSGRSEPQVSVGRRLADRVRIGATTGVAADRDFRAELDVQVTDTTGVRCSYDTYGGVRATYFGNLGCDLRWRLEFE